MLLSRIHALPFLLVCLAATAPVSAQNAMPEKTSPVQKSLKADTPLLPTEMREWRSSDGKSIKAKLLEVDATKETVGLEMDNGNIVPNVPFRRFSEADRKFIQSCRNQVRRDESGITGVSGGDPGMNKAREQARSTFPAAYREIEKDNRRVIPFMTMVLVKAQFSDQPERGAEADDIEHMWVGDFTFDGKEITGTLLSRPGKVKSVKEGDSVTIPLSRLTDWSYALNGKVQGAYTEKLLHSRMSPEEKTAHNEATGVDWDKQ